MKKALTLFAFVVLSQTSHAQVFSSPSLSAVKGHIETNDSSLDLSQIKVVQHLTCKKGWGDGQRSCGTKKTEAKVDIKGNFNLAGIKGESNNWFAAGYDVYYGDEILFSNPFRLRANDDKETIRTLLSNFTIFTVKPFKVNFTTDTGIAFDEWQATDNQNNKVGVYIILNAATTNTIGKILPGQNYIGAIKGNNETITLKPQMIPGTLANALQTASLNYKIDSRYLGNYESKVVAQKEIKLNDEEMMKKLSQVNLATQIIDYTVNGLWNIGIDISFHEGTHYFQFSEPALFIESKCEDGRLVGKLHLNYRTKQDMNEVRPLEGTCAKGKANFDVSLIGVNYSAPKESRPFNLHVRIHDIAADAAKAEVIDLDTQKRYKSYGGVHRCKSFRSSGRTLVCER